MSAQMDLFIEKILAELSNSHYIKPEEIPSIELYMDQVTTFMDEHLSSSKRKTDDKILTKTMINNYAKNNLLPPPVKKKYSRNHLLMMIFIYYLKGFLSIQDIQSLLTPLSSEHFTQEASIPLTDIYEKILQAEQEQLPALKEDIEKKYELSKTMFTDCDDQDFLQNFAFISLLSFDVYRKKHLIEKMIDELFPKEHNQEEKTVKKAKTSKEP